MGSKECCLSIVNQLASLVYIRHSLILRLVRVDSGYAFGSSKSNKRSLEGRLQIDGRVKAYDLIGQRAVPATEECII